MSIDIYKFAGILAFLISWSAMLYVVFSQGKNNSWSISLHTAKTKKAILLLAFMSPLTMGLYMLFVIKWMAPTYHLSTLFILLNVIADTGYILAAWVPSIKGTRELIHNILTGGASVLAIAITYILAHSASIAALPRSINAVSTILMILIIGYLVINKSAWKNYLNYQIVYFLAFNIGLLTTGYLS